MSRYEVLKRDGMARIGRYENEETDLTTPSVVDAASVFPTLFERRLTNVPLSAAPGFVDSYFSPGDGEPVAVHPLATAAAASGTSVLVANWHTTLSNPRTYVDFLTSMKAGIPPDTAWFAPASALPSNACLLVYSGFDIFDFGAVDLKTAQKIFCLPEGEFPAETMETGICGCEGCRRGDLSLHNRLALRREVALVGRFIESGKIRELLESRCRMSVPQVGILRFLDRQYPFMERRLPIARAEPFHANSAESQNRAEIRRFADRVVDRYRPPRSDVAVLLPCSARKPYSYSQSHRLFASVVNRRAHEMIVTSPLGLVPRDLERIYPAAHYDVPVTGYWDREESALIAETLTRYFVRHPYGRVIAHLEGGALAVAETAAEAAGFDLEITCRGRPTAPESLKALEAALEGERRAPTDIVRGTGLWQFGTEIATKGMITRGKGMQMAVLRGKTQVFSLDPGTGLLRPTFDGWRLIPEGYRVFIDEFIPQGDVLVPGIISADDRIREGDEVLVEGPLATATGRAMMGADEMERSGRGVAVRIRKVRKKGE